MTKEEAEYLVKMKLPGGNQLLSEKTIESTSCFAVFAEGVGEQHPNPQDSVLGVGPYIISKETGEIFRTTTLFSVENYLTNFELYGSPAGKSVYGSQEGVWLSSMILKVKDPSKANLKKIAQVVRDKLGISYEGAKKKAQALVEGDVLICQDDWYREKRAYRRIGLHRLVYQLSEDGSQGQLTWS